MRRDVRPRCCSKATELGLPVRRDNMLVLSRKRDESIMIGDDVEITVIDVRGETVKLGVTAPKSIAVYRKEIYEAIQRENIAAARSAGQDLTSIAKALRGRKRKTEPDESAP